MDGGDAGGWFDNFAGEFLEVGARRGLVSRSVIGFLSPAAVAQILAQLNRKIRPIGRGRLFLARAFVLGQHAERPRERFCQIYRHNHANQHSHRGERFSSSSRKQQNDEAASLSINNSTCFQRYRTSTSVKINLFDFCSDRSVTALIIVTYD